MKSQTVKISGKIADNFYDSICNEQNSCKNTNYFHSFFIINGKKEAVFIGVISGLLQDIYFYEGFGVNALINMLICLLAAFIGENIYREKKLIPTISMILLYMLKVLSVFLVLKIAGKTINFEVGIYASLYSAIIMFLGYDFVLRLYDNNYKKKSWRLK